MPSGTQSLYWFCPQFWHSENEHISLRAEWDAYISVEARGFRVSVSHSKPRKFSNLDLIRPEICQCWSEHIQTAATLTQQSVSTETQPSQETQTGSPTECLVTWTTSTVEDGNCRLLKTDVNTEQAQTHLHKWMSSHAHRSLRGFFVWGVIRCYHCNWSNRGSFPAKKELDCDDSLLLSPQLPRTVQLCTEEDHITCTSFPQCALSLWTNFSTHPSFSKSPWPASTSKEHRSS